jgi:hypothetical protein
VRCLALLVCWMFVACSHTEDSAGAPKELIPAEWTVAVDTSAGGDVTTTSLQLPAARQISGLAADQDSRLLLRCVDHRVQAFIDTEEGDSSAVPIQLDSAPACE